MSLSLLLTLLAILALKLIKSEAGNNKDRIWRTRKIKCEKSDCAHLVPDEASNCVNQCTSRKCYEEIYSETPLEDGEIDNLRSRAYVACLREEAKQERVGTVNSYQS
jgi:hypothetical protein